MSIEVRKPTPDEEQDMKTCPVWEKEPSSFPWHYDEKETCLIIDGLVEVVADSGEAVEFGKGDYVVFPQGMDCIWNVKEKVSKHYRFG
jgi:uncharacterized cupin superfamily protein